MTTFEANQVDFLNEAIEVLEEIEIKDMLTYEALDRAIELIRRGASQFDTKPNPKPLSGGVDIPTRFDRLKHQLLLCQAALEHPEMKGCYPARQIDYGLDLALDELGKIAAVVR